MSAIPNAFGSRDEMVQLLSDCWLSKEIEFNISGERALKYYIWKKSSEKEENIPDDFQLRDLQLFNAG